MLRGRFSTNRSRNLVKAFPSQESRLKESHTLCSSDRVSSPLNTAAPNSSLTLQGPSSPLTEYQNVVHIYRFGY